MRVMVRPMHQTAKFIPFVHATKMHAITHADRYSLRQINVMCDQQRLAVFQLRNETLMP